MITFLKNLLFGSKQSKQKYYLYHYSYIDRTTKEKKSITEVSTTPPDEKKPPSANSVEEVKLDSLMKSSKREYQQYIDSKDNLY